MGDGGEGTGVLLAARGEYEERTASVLDPRARPRAARWWCNPAARAAIIELAEASGLALLAPHERDPLQTTSYGTGQLLRAALDAGLTALTLCVGGSATVDGGAGCVQAFGCPLLEARGLRIAAPVAGGTLSEIASLSIVKENRHFGLRIFCDVDHPLLGPHGAAAVFGPQKGASPEAVAKLERGLAHWAGVLERATGRDVRTIRHGGAAGGVPAGLHAVCNAALTPGAMAVAHEVGLFERLVGCDLCFTGEGRLDDQTAGGKVVSAVARLAGAHRVPAIALVGAVEASSRATTSQLAAELGLTSMHVITPDNTPIEQALRDTAANLRRAAAETVAASRVRA
jgi:glycerate kinase